MASIERQRVATGVGLSLALAVAVGGCARRVEFTQVSGMVTLNNQPLPGVAVVFFPQDERIDRDLVAQATTDESGRYTLGGPDGQSGAVVGTNRVLILPRKTPRSANERRMPQGPPVPANYTTVKLTPLVVEVKAGGPQTIDLPLSND